MYHTVNMRNFQNRDRIILDSLVKDGQEYLYAVVDTNSGTLYFHGSEIGKAYLRNKLDFLNQFWSFCMSKCYRKTESDQGDLHVSDTMVNTCMSNSDENQNIQAIVVNSSQIPVRGRPRKKKPKIRNQQIPKKMPKLNKILYLDDAEKPSDNVEAVQATHNPVSTPAAIARGSDINTGVAHIPAVSSGGNNSSMTMSDSDIIKHITSPYDVQEGNVDSTYQQNDCIVYTYPSLVSVTSDSTTADTSVNDGSETSSKNLDKLNFQSNENKHIQLMFIGNNTPYITDIVNCPGEQRGTNWAVAGTNDYSAETKNDRSAAGPLVSSSTGGGEMYETLLDNNTYNGDRHSIKILPLTESMKVEESPISSHRNNFRTFSVFAQADKDKSVKLTRIGIEKVNNEPSELVKKAYTIKLTETGSEQINKSDKFKLTDKEQVDKSGTVKITDRGSKQVDSNVTVTLTRSEHINGDSAVKVNNANNELLNGSRTVKPNDAESEQLNEDVTVKLTDTENEQGNGGDCEKFPEEVSDEIKCEEPWECEEMKSEISEDAEMMNDEDYNYESELDSSSDEYTTVSESRKPCKKEKPGKCKNKPPLDLHCTICNRIFKRPKRFEAHVLNHSKTKHECQKCGKSFNRVQTLHKHTHIKHSGVLFQCEFCGKFFEDKQQLKIHIQKIHVGITPYECQICHEKFRWYNTFQSHYLRHSDKPLPKYLCCTCGKSYTSRDILNRHLKIHMEDKRHKCEHCDRTFVQSYALKRHLRCHTGEKPYKCKICNEGFAHNVSLKNHMRKAHK